MIKSSKPCLIRYNRFAAIDFETADYGRDSACAVSLIVVERGKVCESVYSLIKPPRRNFVFSYLHGITWNDVAEKPAFHEVWTEFCPLLEKVDFIAAHNASFDRDVLFTCCGKRDIEPPNARFLCTMKLARKLWNVYPTKLSDVCRRFQIPLDHHNAASDALACASIVLKAKKGIPETALLSGKWLSKRL